MRFVFTHIYNEFENHPNNIISIESLLDENYVLYDTSFYNFSDCASIVSYYNIRLDDGIYILTLNNNNNNNNHLQTLYVFCKFDYINEYAWTLIESFSLQFRDEMNRAFYFDFGVNNNNNINITQSMTKMYRLSKNEMNLIEFESKYFLSTCNFDISQTIDYFLVSTVYDNWYLTDRFNSACKSVRSINIRGYNCINSTVAIFGYPTHIHIDSSSHYGCQCESYVETSIWNENNFGQYSTYNPLFSCSMTNNSTTNYWFGNKIGYIESFSPS